MHHFLMQTTAGVIYKLHYCELCLDISNVHGCRGNAEDTRSDHRHWCDCCV